MGRYWLVLKTHSRALLQYRAAVIAGIITQFFWGVIQVMIFCSFYGQSVSVEPISLRNAITFVWVGQAMLHLLPWTLDEEIREGIRKGDALYVLLRPIDLYSFWFTRSLSTRLVPTLIRALPVGVLGGLFFGMGAPASWAAWMAFSASVLAALVLASAITTLAIVSLFWTLSGEGLNRLLRPVSVLLSGLLVPLPLFPSWMQSFLMIQPLRGVMDIPCRIYTGIISPRESLLYILFQLAWAAIFVIGGRSLLKRALTLFVVQGG